MKEITKANPGLSENNTREILKKRAVKLSKEIGTQETDLNIREGLIFTLGNESFVIEVNYINEVLYMENIANLPCVPSMICGLINIRGRIIALINLKDFFNFSVNGIQDMHDVIIVESQGTEFGLLVDRIIGRTEVNTLSIQKNIHIVNDIDDSYLLGVMPNRFVVLDIKKIITDNRLIINEQV